MLGKGELLRELDVLDERGGGGEAVELILVLQVSRGELGGYQPLDGAQTYEYTRNQQERII